jgi:hypothetical protein
MEPDKIPGQLVTRRLHELRQHPSYARLGLTVPISKLSALARRGDLAYMEPLTITKHGIIVDGYARFELARQQGRLTLSCIEIELTEEEALRCLIQRQCRSNGMNDFLRILLALELESGLKVKAESNQRFGGQNKGSAKLTEAERVNSLKQVADDAGVCMGNVSKVKHLIRKADPEILQALRSGEVRIHRAWLWSKESLDDQCEELRLYRIEKGVKKTARALVSRQLAEISPRVVDPRSFTVVDLSKLVMHLSSPESNTIIMALIDAPGKGVFLTEELFRVLKAQQESTLTC